MYGMPHASTWNIGVIGMYTSSRWSRWPARGAQCAERRRSRERVQHELAVAVVDAFWIAGRAGRVEGRRLGVLVEIAELEVRRSLSDECLVLADDRQRVRRDGLAVGKHHDL